MANTEAITNGIDTRGDLAFPPCSTSVAVAVWEITSIIISGLIAEWVVMCFAPGNKTLLAIPAMLAFSLVLYSQRQRGESIRTIGLSFENFVPAAVMLVVPTFVSAVLVISIGWRWGSIRIYRDNLLLWSLGLLVWAFCQQFFLQGYVNRRAQLIFGKGKASALLVAIVFASMHLPNPWLSVATFIGGIVWAFVYQRHPNLFAIAISHALLSFLLAVSLPNWMLNNLRVGFKYLG